MESIDGVVSANCVIPFELGQTVGRMTDGRGD
jgi:hypothetical protein